MSRKSGTVKSVIALFIIMGLLTISLFMGYKLAEPEIRKKDSVSQDLINQRKELAGKETEKTQQEYVTEEKAEDIIEENTEENIEELEKDMEQRIAAVTEETLAYYQTLEPACDYVLSDGRGYEFLGVDRALGSNYYIAVWRNADQSIEIATLDPFNGSGGTSCWVSFLEGDQIGFAGLAYSGGSLGSLYRTEDGGRTFQSIEYPSPDIALSDGTLYNPFVMPEKVWEEDGMLYLSAGQGPDGDYYGEQGFCAGIYQSTDAGITWTYLREEPVLRSQEL